MEKLNIILYGADAFDDSYKIFKDYKINFYNKNDKNITYKEGIDEKKWNYFIISGSFNNDKNELIKSILTKHIKSENLENVKSELEEMKKDIEKKNYFELLELIEQISKKISENKKFYDVLIVIVDKLKSENSKSIFEYFQNFSDSKKINQPFILYLTKEENDPKVEQLYQSVKKDNLNNNFDKRNFSAFKFPLMNQDFIKFNHYLMKCLNYYHEKGTLTNYIDFNHSFNILVCGPSGSGKSSFINQFLKEKQAKEGEGRSVTQKIVKYYHKEYPIIIYDTPGFENESTVKIVKGLIIKFKENIYNSKDHIDLIIYYCKLEERTFLNIEIDFIKELCKDNHIIFVANTFGKTQKSKNTERLIKIKKEDLRQILKNEKKDIVNSIVENMIIVNQISSFEEIDDEKPILKKAYGMDSFFKKLYDIYKGETIDIQQIEKSNTVNEMMENIQKYNLIKHIKNIEDIIIYKKISASKQILSFSQYDFFVFIFRDSRRKDLLSKLRKIYDNKSNKDIDSLFLEIYNKAENKTNKEKEINEFFESIKRFKDIFETEGFNFNAWFYNSFTLLMGYIFIKEYEKDFGLYDINTKHFIKELASNINISINGFQILSQEWEEIYRELKEGNIQRDWVKNFFNY